MGRIRGSSARRAGCAPAASRRCWTCCQPRTPLWVCLRTALTSHPSQAIKIAFCICHAPRPTLPSHPSLTTPRPTPVALKPLAAHTPPGTLAQGPSGMRSGTAGILNDSGATDTSARTRRRDCGCGGARTAAQGARGEFSSDCFLASHAAPTWQRPGASILAHPSFQRPRRPRLCRRGSHSAHG